MVREKRGSRAKTGSIFETPRIKKMLSEPVGTPIDLTREEALAILDAHVAHPANYDQKAAEKTHRELTRIRRESGALLVRSDSDD